MLNKCFFQGRLTRDPELRYTQAGVAVAAFSLAVDRDLKNKATGERDTDFIDCVAWRGTAEFVSRFFAKGQLATVVGSLQFKSWTDKDGKKHRTAEILVENVYFCESKRDADPLNKLAADAAPVSGDFTEEEDSGELPF